MATVTIDQIKTARRGLASYIHKTPMVQSPALSKHCRVPVFLKLEHQQTSGSFKIRGASTAIARLGEPGIASGVVAVSTGNHGRGIAYAADQAGIEATIFMSSLVPENKLAAIRDLGATIRIEGKSQDEAESAAMEFCNRTGAVYLSPFDHPDVIGGQGTLGLEIIEQQPDVETILVPLSGGGLISGIALAVKASRPDCRVYGISMENGPAMYHSQKAGKPVNVDESPSFADSLGGGIGLESRYTFDIVKHNVDDILLVTEAEIAEGVRHAYFEERQVIEGGAAVGISALARGKLEPEGPVVVVLTGCNIDTRVHKAILDGANDLSKIQVRE